jgi:hypothetical protein
MDTRKYLPRVKAAISLEVKRPEHESHQSSLSEIKKERSHALYCTSSIEANMFRCYLSINLHAARRCGIQCTEFVTNSHTYQQLHSTTSTLTNSYTHQQPHSPTTTLTNSHTRQQLHSPIATLINSYTHHTHRFLATSWKQPEGNPFLLSSDSCVSFFKRVLSINDIWTQTVPWITGACSKPYLHIMRRSLLFSAA